MSSCRKLFHALALVGVVSGALLSVTPAFAASDGDGGRCVCGWWREPCPTVTDRGDGGSATPQTPQRTGPAVSAPLLRLRPPVPDTDYSFRGPVPAARSGE